MTILIGLSNNAFVGVAGAGERGEDFSDVFGAARFHRDINRGIAEADAVARATRLVMP